MKWRIWKRPPEWKKISLYAVVILVSLFVCEFAFAARKAKGVTCVKDFIITYNYRVVPYIAIPVIMVLLISYFRRMYDDNRMVRYVNIRNFYISVIGGGIGRIVLYVVIMAVRGEKREYLAAKSVAVFMTAGVSAVFPLLLNLMLTMTMFPVINYDWYQLPNYKALFMNLAVKNVIAYCIVYMALIFVFAGLIAGLALSLSLYANNRFVVLSLPFLICIVSGRLVAYSGNPVIRGLAIQKVFYVPQSSPTTLVSLCILFVVLVLCGYVHFMVRGVKMDVL